ncbi:hypothetical protein EV426DRAFT_573973 [Tirmania nivea]|nr:hypothetical protein EV426DRAFT_573973 [Tirmania nivea]
MPPGRKGARKRNEAMAAPSSPPLQQIPEPNPVPVARPSRALRKSSKDIQPRGELPTEQEVPRATTQPLIEPVPVKVPEEVDEVEEEESEEDEGGVELLDNMDSIDTRSMSGSTSGTQFEADTLDATLAIEAIPALHRKSQEILEFLLASTPGQLLKKVRQPGSSAGKRLDLATKDFSVTKDLFATTTEFIKVNAVNQIMDTDIFAPLICKANFAALALGLVRAIGLSNEAVQYLGCLEDYFPGAFFPSPGDWLEDVRTQVNKLMLEIRTQHFVAAAYYEQAIPFDELLRQIFLETDADPDSNDDDSIHEAWTMGRKPKGWDSLTKDEKRNCKSRIDRIRTAYCVVEGGNDIMEPLDTEFLVQHWPWDKFVEDMMKFIAQRTNAMNAETDFPDLLEIAEQARKRGLQSQEDEEEDDVADGNGSFVDEPDAANDSNWLTDQSRTLVDPAVETRTIVQTQVNDGSNRRTTRSASDKLSSSTQLKFLKKQKMLLEAPNSPPAIKKALSQKPKVVTTKAGMKTLKALAQNTAEEAAAVAPPPPPAVTHARARGRTRANTNGPVPVQQATASAANEQPHFVVGFDDPLPIPPGTADQIKMFNEISAKRDKENRGIPPPQKSIYDRQPGAQKLVFNEDEELVESQSGDERAKTSKQGGRKRSRDEVQEDDPFSLDVRPEDPQRKKRSRAVPAPAAPVAPPANKKASRSVASAASQVVRAGRRRRRQLPAEVASRNVRRPSQERQQLVPRRNRIVSVEPPPRGSVPPRGLARRQSHDDILDELHGEHELTGERIRYLAAANRQRAIRKPVQVRTPWSDAEERKLVEMIGLYGCRWALIEQEASEWFADRGQVALKDKARNMKFALLK